MSYDVFWVKDGSIHTEYVVDHHPVTFNFIEVETDTQLKSIGDLLKMQTAKRKHALKVSKATAPKLNELKLKELAL